MGAESRAPARASDHRRGGWELDLKVSILNDNPFLAGPFVRILDPGSRSGEYRFLMVLSVFLSIEK
jgi:hypothetical protein